MTARKKRTRVHRVCAPDTKCPEWSVRWGKTIVVKFPADADGRDPKRAARRYAKRAKEAMRRA